MFALLLWAWGLSSATLTMIIQVADPVVANVKADTGLTYSDQTQNGSEKLAALKHLSS